MSKLEFCIKKKPLRMNEPNYSSKFYSDVAISADMSAQIVVPLVYDLIKPHNVVDVGCGSGAWLRQFLNQGCQVQGLDGPWVENEQLLIPVENIKRVDLANFSYEGEKFDLAISLEVAEHLPESSADNFVAAMTKLAPAIVFSAAIPGQGGTFHLNEQWQSYWIEKFRLQGFECYDVFRPKLWNDVKVASHYVQNMFLFLKSGHSVASMDQVEKSHVAEKIVDIVHPRIYADKTSPLNYSIKKFLFIFFPAYLRSIFK